MFHQSIRANFVELPELRTIFLFLCTRPALLFSNNPRSASFQPVPVAYFPFLLLRWAILDRDVEIVGVEVFGS